MTWKRKDKFPAKLLEYWIGKRRCYPRPRDDDVPRGKNTFKRIRSHPVDWNSIGCRHFHNTGFSFAFAPRNAKKKKSYEYGLESGWLPGGMFHTTVKYLLSWLVVFGTVGCCVGRSMLILLYLKISFYWFSMRVQKNLLFFKNLF